MYSRLLAPSSQSFFLFGPRGTGKSSWLHQRFGGAPYFDLLDSATYLDLLAAPFRLSERIGDAHRGWVVIDEVQRAPELLNEVHRLIENRRLKFALSGSSARKLKRKNVNLLAGRAVTRRMFPLTATELGSDFDLLRCVKYGLLPTVHDSFNAQRATDYLKSYVGTYLREEVQQEGLTRNVGAFSRFLEAASFSQAAPLNISAVARDAHVERKVVESYFTILEDLLIATRIPVFTRRARRALAVHPKFYFFDAGVFRAVRPRGPLDSAEEVDGAAIETLVFQEVRAHDAYRGWDYSIAYWRTRTDAEVDLVLYGERGLVAIEVKRSARLRGEDFAGLELFLEDYPMAKAFLIHTGERDLRQGSIRAIPIGSFLKRLPELL